MHRFHTSLLGTLLPVLALSGRAMGQSVPPLTPEQALDRHALGDPRFSPAGDRIAFTVTDPPKGDARNTDIWVYDRGAKTARPFATSLKSDVSPRWSPDGETIAFISDRDGTRQIYLLIFYHMCTLS
jgi:dipeptidyl aminopeptidase/acylaminoacyl peptidase